MKRRIIRTVVVVVALAVGFVASELIRSAQRKEHTTLLSLSPDEAKRVHLVEIPGGLLDRNFELRLEDMKSGRIDVIFQSPDEGRPEGSERIIWSQDSQQFLLVGRHFHADAPLSTGESTYLLYNVPSGNLRCNSSQLTDLKRFSIEDVQAVRWQHTALP